MKIDNIREYKSKDLDNIMEIWVNTNIEAHNFSSMKIIGEIILIW